MWSDLETSTDLLGYTVHANLLKQVIMEKRNLPVTIGLYGDWGSGKSSILKILQERIEQDADSKDNSLVIYFDGWSFESFDDAKMALIQGIVDKLESSKSLKDDVKERVKNVAKSVKEKIFSMRTLMWSMKNIAAPAILAHATGGVSLLSGLVSIFKRYDNDDKKKELVDKLTGDEAENFLFDALDTHIKTDQFSAVREFRDEFKKMIGTTGKDRIVILIDDLDRCLPEHIIANLEAIKLFLNVEKTVFVIAADQYIVSGAIKKQYGDKIELAERPSGTRSIGEDYMDKFIQIPYNIPKLSNQEVETYITLLFCQSMLDKVDFDKIHIDYQKFIVEHKFEGYGWDNIKDMQGVKNNDSLRSTVSFMAHCTSSISKSLHRNPRLIKRFLNAFEIRTQLLQQSGNLSDNNKFVLLKLMLLEISHSQLFTQLNEWTIADKGHSIEIVELEKESKNDNIDIEKFRDWNFDDVKELLNMEPLFSSTDLREIYWVSRDKLIDGMGGTTLVPSRIKQLFNSVYTAMSDSIIQNKCSSQVRILNAEDLESFYELLDDKMLTESDKKQPYVIYYYMIETETDRAYSCFLKIFSRIVEKAPFSISNYMKKLLENHNKDSDLIQILRRNKLLFNASGLSQRKVFKTKN